MKNLMIIVFLFCGLLSSGAYAQSRCTLSDDKGLLVYLGGDPHDNEISAKLESISATVDFGGDGTPSISIWDDITGDEAIATASQLSLTEHHTDKVYVVNCK